MTQEELADATRMRRTDINALVKGRVDAGADRLRRIADALGVSVLELGAPEGEADERGRTLLDRLERVEGDLAESLLAQAKLTRSVSRLQVRVRQLEVLPAPDQAADGP